MKSSFRLSYNQLQSYFSLFLKMYLFLPKKSCGRPQSPDPPSPLVLVCLQIQNPLPPLPCGPPLWMTPKGNFPVESCCLDSWFFLVWGRTNFQRKNASDSLHDVRRSQCICGRSSIIMSFPFYSWGKGKTMVHSLLGPLLSQRITSREIHYKVNLGTQFLVSLRT